MPGHPPVRQVDLRLVVQLELAAIQAAPQLTEQGQPGRRVAVQLGTNRSTPLRRCLARYIATSARCISSSSAVASSGNMAMPMLTSMTNDMPSSRIGSATAARSRAATSRAADASFTDGQQHGELVAAESRDQVTGPDAVRQPVRHQPQQPVADRVPERVVDFLQAAVEVEQQEADLGAVAGRLRQRAVELQISSLRFASPVSSS